RWTTKQLHTQNHLISVLNKLIKEDPKSAEGWSNISYIASQITQHHENIKLDKYGYKKFSDLITALRLYDMRRESNKILIKIKTKKAQPTPASTAAKPNTQTQNHLPVNKNESVKSSVNCFPATAIKVQVTSAPSVDVVLFRLANNGKVRGDEDMIFYGQTHSEDGSIILDQQIDDLTSVSEFGCDLRAQPTVIQQIAFALSSELSSMTADPRQPIVQLTIDNQQTNLCLFSDDFDISQKTGKSLLLFTLARLDNPSQGADQWQFIPKHQNIEGDLRTLCEQYGVEISDE
ncbi:MAG: TerD family protein, partial [Psychrobacter sp.]|nr:TerD family protein [Psychrobacter sp.]